MYNKIKVQTAASPHSPSVNMEDYFSKSSHSPSVKMVGNFMENRQKITDFCVPINMGFPDCNFNKELYADMEERLKYYPSEPKVIAEKAASQFVVQPSEVIVGNGSTEIFYFLLSTQKRRLLTPIPTFGRWTDAPSATGHYVHCLMRKESDDFALDIDELIKQTKVAHIDTLIISNPNNPTGALSSKKELIVMIEKLSHLDLIIIDESFLDFSNKRIQTSLINEVAQMDNVVVLKSLGKSLGLHGARLGIMVGSKKLMSRYKKLVPFWNVNGVAEGVLELLPKHQDAFQTGLENTISMTQQMKAKLDTLPGFTTYNTEANFVYAKSPQGTDPIKLRDFLLNEYGFFVRSCGNKSGATDSHFRIATRPMEDVNKLCEAILKFQSMTNP